MDNNCFSDEQMQHLINIVLASERWARLEGMGDSLTKLGYLNDEAKYLYDRASQYNKYMVSEMVKLSGRDETDLFISDMYNYTEDLDKEFGSKEN